MKESISCDCGDPTCPQCAPKPLESREDFYQRVVVSIRELAEKYRVADDPLPVAGVGFIEDNVCDVPSNLGADMPRYVLDEPVDKYNQARVQWKYREGQHVYLLIQNSSITKNTYLVINDGGKRTIPFGVMRADDTPLLCAQRQVVENIGYAPGASDCAYVPGLDAYTVNYSVQIPVDAALPKDAEWVGVKELENLAEGIKLTPDNDNLDTRDSYTSFNKESFSRACEIMCDPSFHVAHLMWNTLREDAAIRNRQSLSACFTEDELRARVKDKVVEFLGREPISEGEVREACFKILMGEK